MYCNFLLLISVVSSLFFVFVFYNICSVLCILQALRSLNKEHDMEKLMGLGNLPDKITCFMIWNSLSYQKKCFVSILQTVIQLGMLKAS